MEDRVDGIKRVFHDNSMPVLPPGVFGFYSGRLRGSQEQWMKVFVAFDRLIDQDGNMKSTPMPSSHAKDTTQLLLESAIMCFAGKGFDAVSIREIAERAGKPVSLIGYHFGSKENLYLKCFQYLFDCYPPSRMLDAAHQDLEAIRKDGRLAAETLRYIIRGMMADMYGQEGDPLKDSCTRLFMEEMNSPRPLLHQMIRDRVAEDARLVKCCIAALKPNLPDTETSFLGQCIFAQCMIHRLAAGMNALIWQPLPPSGPPEATADRIVDFVLQGLGYQEQP